MPERFVSEPIETVVKTSDTMRMSLGEPGLPRLFVWRDRLVEITAVLRAWHDTGPCRHGSDEMYVRKHWYQLATRDHGIWKIYFERHSRRGSKGPRWWLFSIDDSSQPSAL
jgi:phosphoribosylglycinamide formyltransferase-1